MKVCPDSWSNNEKATVLQLKMENFVKFEVIKIIGIYTLS